MKIQLIVAVALLMFGCAKNVTPKKVDRHLVGGNWKIVEISDDGVNTVQSYIGVTFTFQSDGIFKIMSGTSTDVGTWAIGEDKNPVIIDINVPATPQAAYFSDDWAISELNKSECFMTRNVPGSTDKIRFRKLD